MRKIGLFLLLLSCTSESKIETGVHGPVQDILRLAFPLEEPEQFSVVLGVDHDPVIQEGLLGQGICTDYAGRSFPHCYDEHDGSDFILRGGFSTMDAGSVFILAAADGVVVRVEDGHYDRCHGDLGSGDIDCDGFPMQANAVVLEHATGHQSWYWHMMNGSTQVIEGQSVLRGDRLGLVGSSGRSSQPHLHFEVHDEQGAVIDPYAGEFSQDESLWCDQGSLNQLPGYCHDKIGH